MEGLPLNCFLHSPKKIDHSICGPVVESKKNHERWQPDKDWCVYYIMSYCSKQEKGILLPISNMWKCNDDFFNVNIWRF